MKITKKAFEALQQELRLFKAMRWPDYREPERLPLPTDGGHVQGFDFNRHRASSGAVSPAWTSLSRHGEGTFDSRNCDSHSRDSKRVFATRLDALLAMRLALTRECADRLASVDLEIEREEAAARVQGESS